MNRRFSQSSREPQKRLRVNEMIRISQVRLVDENNEQVGVVDTMEAKRRAREAGLDLVEVSPQSSPPVCRIMDYGKWKYQQKKKEQKARSHSKQSELKEVRLRPQIDEHDLLIKTNKSREFLDEGHKVQFTMQFKGREMAHRELGTQLMNQVAAGLSDISKVEQYPRAMGRRMTMIVVPERKSTQPGGAKPAGDARPAAAAPPAASLAASGDGRPARPAPAPAARTPVAPVPAPKAAPAPQPVVSGKAS